MPVPFLGKLAVRSLPRLRLSVRARIIGLAIIPVIGFFANGIAFTVGESEVDDAFASVKRASGVADASRDFKSGLATMESASKDFVAQPGRELNAVFKNGEALA